MAVLFSAVTLSANDQEVEFFVGGIPREYATLLLKNEFNLKAIPKMLGHAKEIVTADNYIDNHEIIADGVS